jgi:hypothetical protein
MDRYCIVALLALSLTAGANAGERATGTLAASTESGPRLMAVGDFDRVIPQVVDGAGWKTSFVLTNLDTKTVYVQMGFFSDNGSAMQLPIVGLGTLSGVFGSLAVNESVSLETEGKSASLTQGFARFFTFDRPADQPNAAVVLARIGGMAIFCNTVPGRGDFEAVVPISPAYEGRFTLLFDNRSGFATGVALVNGSASSSPVTIVVRDMSGNILLRDAFTLESFNKATFVVASRYPQTSGRNGIMQVSTTSIALSGLGLRFNPSGAFTSSHSLSSDVDPDAPSIPSTPPSTLPGISATCSALEGASVFANDGQFLGKITSNTYAADSLGNPYGRYGSEYSSVSIFNPYGKYGGEYSAVSPFNPYTSTPPVIFVDGRAVAFLTVNLTGTPRIDPRTIYPCIGRR